MTYLNSIAEKIKLHPKTANHATKSSKNTTCLHYTTGCHVRLVNCAKVPTQLGTFIMCRVCFVTFWNNVLFAFSTFIHDASSRLTHLNTLLNYSACIFPSNLADFCTFCDRICCLEYNELETWKNVLTRLSRFFH